MKCPSPETRSFQKKAPVCRGLGQGRNPERRNSLDGATVSQGVRCAIKKRLRRATIAFNYGHYVEGSFTSWRSSSAARPRRWKKSWDPAFVGLGRRRSQTEAFGSSRQICVVSWCRRYRVIPKSTVRIARTIQMLTRMGASLLGASARRVSQQAAITRPKPSRPPRGPSWTSRRPTTSGQSRPRRRFPPSQRAFASPLRRVELADRGFAHFFAAPM
jgi:hypothetical protein